MFSPHPRAMPTARGPRDFKEKIQARVRRDQAFHVALLPEAVDCLLAGDIDTARPCRETISTQPSASTLGPFSRKLVGGCDRNSARSSISTASRS